MFPCLPYTATTPFMAPNSIKEDEETINTINRELLKTARETGKDYANVKIVKISKKQLAKILRKEPNAVQIHLKSPNSEVENLSKDWDELPQQVKDEVMKLTTQKTFRKCIKNWPCKYTHGLIQLYHNAQLLREEVEKIEASKGNRKAQMSRSDVDFSKEDDSTCKTLIKEMKNQKTDMKTLKNIYEKIKNKLKFHSEETVHVKKHLEEVNKKMHQVNEIVKKFEPEGKTHPLKEEQQAIKINCLNNALSLEEEEIFRVKEEVEMRLRRKEEWKEQEKNWDHERCKERETDTLLVLKSTNLMETYIQELKSKINL